MRLIVGITGASGVIYGVRFLEACRKLGVETDLVISRTAELLLKHELGKSRADIETLASESHAPDDLMAPIASGSRARDGMVIIPCSMSTLGKIASGIADNLITRAAGVILKHRKPLVLVPRETPLTSIHLENMLRLHRAGAVILPASPAFYHRPKSIPALVDYVVGRTLELFGIEHELYEPWGGRRTA
jgi:4-hydroxy-3-polyprenylbenzoate decarboxylase